MRQFGTSKIDLAQVVESIPQSDPVEITPLGERDRQISILKRENPLLQKSIVYNTDDEIFKTITISLAKAYTDLGQKQPSEPDMTYMANELSDTIPRRFPSIRLSEIPEAFANGIRGYYGKFYGLNVVTFETFVEAHLTSEKREEMVRDLPKLEIVSEPGDEVKFNTAKNNALQALQDRKAGKDITLVAPFVYGFLDRLKLIPFSASKKWEFVEQASDQLMKEAIMEGNIATNREQRRAANAKLEAVEAGTAVHLIKQRAKCVALNRLLDDCILANVDLGQLIEEKKDIYLKLLSDERDKNEA